MNRSQRLLVTLAAILAIAGLPVPARASALAPNDTLTFAPAPSDSLDLDEGEARWTSSSDRWLRPTNGDRLITDRDEWRSRAEETHRIDLLVDYNRVDRLRLGLAGQFQGENPMLARLGVRAEYPLDRQVFLYGIQLEQPVFPPGRVALGVSMVRRTEHHELQQVSDVENSLMLLFGRQDYRDYFEREGFGAYLSWRIPRFSTISVHLRNDQYTSLPLVPNTKSWFMQDRPLRDNPAIDDGESHSASLRLEKQAHSTEFTRAGLYHWIDLETSGHGLGGDFEYTRLIGDLRSRIRLSPAQTLALRGVVGHTFDGTLPAQKQFLLGGPDGLRAHAIDSFHGDQLVLGQAEYTVGIWPLRSGMFDAGLHAIAFVDVGHAWNSSGNDWDVKRQHLSADGGFGVATSEDNVRVYFARSLAEPTSDFLVSVRLRRPF